MKPTRIIQALIFFEVVFGQKEIGYHVGLLIDGVKFCSGALIKENFVISAAVCVHKAFEIDVVLGINHTLQPTETAYISTTFVINETIALIKIPTLNTAKYKVTVLQLPTYSLVENGNLLTLTGFNLKNDGRLGTEEVQVTRIDPNYSGSSDVFNNSFCFKLQNEKSNGYRNNGSPMVHENILVGIAGVHMGNKENAKVSCALNIFPIIDWINANIN